MNSMNITRIGNHLRVALKPSALALAMGTWLAAGTALAAPANDNFANAIDLTGAGTGQTGDLIFGDQTGTNNADATLETGEPNSPGSSNTVWFKWTSPADGDLTVTTLGSTNSVPSEWDAVLGIYTGTSVDALTALGGSPQDGDYHEQMTVPVTAGTTYRIQVAGFGNEVAANILLTWSLVATVYQADILTFGPYAAIGEVFDNAADIAWTVPFESNLATLAPTFTLSPGATATVGGNPVVSGSPVDFSGGPVVFTVTAQGASPVVNAYTVTVTLAPNESALVWDLAGGGDWDFTTANWLGLTSATTQPFSNALNVIFDKTAGGTITIPSVVYPLSTTVSAASGTYVFVGGPIASGSLTKNGGGTLQVMGVANIPPAGAAPVLPNTYPGGTVIDGGRLILGGVPNGISPDVVNPVGSGMVTLNAGTLEFQRVRADNALTVNGGTLFSNNGWGATWSGPVTLNATTTCDVVYTLTCSGDISGTGGLTKTSNGPLILSGTNTYTGPTSVTAGTLQCDNPDALAGGDLTVSTGAKVNLNYTGTKNVAALTLGGVPQPGGTHGSSASDATYKNDTYFAGTGTVTTPLSSQKNMLTFSFGALGAATIGETTINLDVPAGTDRTNLAPTYTVSAEASGSPPSGTARNFTSAQTYTVTAQDGTTKDYSVTVTEAILPDIFTWATAASGNWSVSTNWTNEALIDTPPLADGRESYTLNFDVAGTYTATNNQSVGFKLNQLNLASTVTLAGNGLAFVANGATLPTINRNSNGTTVVISNALDLVADTTFGGTGNGQVNLTGLISGAGSLTKNGSGTLRIYNVNNSFAGGTIINSGTLFGDIDAKVGSGPITLNGGVLWMWRFKPTNALTVNGGSITSENGFNQNLLAGPITLNATLPLDVRYQLTCSNTISGVGGLSLSRTAGGNGLMILSNTCTSTYTGPTTVSTGATLRVDRPEALSGSSAIAISSTGKMNLNYAGTKNVASLAIGGVAQTNPGTYGSVASGADFQNDTYFIGTGTLTLGGASGFGTWASTNAPGQTPGEDYDNDGVENGIEYFMGQTGSSFTAMPGLDATNTVTWTKDPAYSGTWQVQTSPDLAIWTDVAGTDNGTSVSYTLAAGGGKLFVRLLVTPTP